VGHYKEDESEIWDMSMEEVPDPGPCRSLKCRVPDIIILMRRCLGLRNYDQCLIWDIEMQEVADLGHYKEDKSQIWGMNVMLSPGSGT